jgi:hypothetical protein
LVISGANVHDKWKALPTLDDAKTRTPDHQRPKHVCLDKGYDYRDVERGVKRRGIEPHLRRRGEPPLVGCAKGKPRRWVVERTNSWHNRFRSLLIRWERKAENYLALCHLGSALIAFQRARR